MTRQTQKNVRKCSTTRGWLNCTFQWSRNSELDDKLATKLLIWTWIEREREREKVREKAKKKKEKRHSQVECFERFFFSKNASRVCDSDQATRQPRPVISACPEDLSIGLPTAQSHPLGLQISFFSPLVRFLKELYANCAILNIRIVVFLHTFKQHFT